jgi:indolepyruvate ferredoxin oxidoreductase
MRQLERALRDEYRAMVLRLAAELSAQTHVRAVAAAEAADLVRGYEDVKLAGVRRYRAKLAELGLSRP